MRRNITCNKPGSVPTVFFTDVRTDEMLVCAFDADRPCHSNCVACETAPGGSCKEGSTATIVSCKRGDFVIGHLREF